MGVDATSRTAQIVLDLPGFVVLAAGEYGGELELLVETTTTVVHCHRCSGRAQAHDRREHLLRDVPVADRAAVLVWWKRAIEVLDGRVPSDIVTEIWASALDAAWDGRPVWFHGDVAPGNLLVRDGALAAVIACGVGDPACDVAIAWMFLSGAGREAFRARLDIDPGTWARGRGWALWKALIVYAGALHGDQGSAARATRIIDEVLTEYAESDLSQRAL